MKYIPTKKQWGEWSLPSKLTTIGVLLAIISIVLTIAFERNPFKKTVSVDNMAKAVEYLRFARKNHKDGNYERMLTNSEKAFELANSTSNLEYLCFALFENNMFDECLNKLIENEARLGDFGNWLLGCLLVNEGKYDFGLKKFKNLRVQSVPIEFRIDALDAYLSAANAISNNEFRSSAQRIIMYVSKQIEVNSTSGTMNMLTTGENIELMSFEANTLIFLPGIYFRVAVLLYHSGHLSNYDFVIVLKYLNKGFSSGILSFPSEHYLFTFKRFVNTNRSSLNLETRKLFCETLISSRKKIRNALEGNIRIGGITVRSNFTETDIQNFNTVVKITDDIINSTINSNCLK